MIADKYKIKIKEIISKHLSGRDRAFIFGSSVGSNDFSDVDIGIISKPRRDIKIHLISAELEDSTIPYKIDLVDFNQVDAKFREMVFNSEILWII